MDVKEGIFRQTPAGGVLVGSRCGGCGQVHFPAVTLCLGCLGEEVREIELGREGELFCETTVHMATANFSPPFSVGYVKLPEGVKLFTPLRPVPGRAFRVGMKMELELVPLWSEEGKEVISYRFFPL